MHTPIPACNDLSLARRALVWHKTIRACVYTEWRAIRVANVRGWSKIEFNFCSQSDRKLEIPRGDLPPHISLHKIYIKILSIYLDKVSCMYVCMCNHKYFFLTLIKSATYMYNKSSNHSKLSIKNHCQFCHFRKVTCITTSKKITFIYGL